MKDALTYYSEVMKEYDDPRRVYHGRNHIEKMLKIYNSKLAMYNDENVKQIQELLPTAIVYHDVVYDELPDKEVRSASQFVRDCVNNGNFTIEEEMLISGAIAPGTVSHLFVENNPVRNLLIILDLYDLAMGNEVVEHNWHLIYEEMCRMNGDISLQDFARGNINFMLGLLENSEKNIEHYSKHMFENSHVTMSVFNDVIHKIPEGIKKTIDISMKHI